ncbi:MAG: response regulator, partial [Bacteroidota bacterium]|nr:response regulator [Bacteroidota bacterium]
MKTILIIEDNADILSNIAEILELAGYKVVTALNGKLGVEAAIENNPDLVICDVMMPLLDGYGVLHILQNNNQLQHAPFIFLSAKNEMTELRKGMDLGADDYVTKPFDATELLNVVETRLKKADLLKSDLPDNGLQGLNQLVELYAGTETFKKLSENRKIIIYKKKQIIYSEGNNPNRLFYILKGKVKTFKTHADGKDFTLELYGEKDYFGYVAMLEETVYKESAEAMVDCEIAVIPREEFELLVYKDKQVAKKFLMMLANNITEKENKLISQAYNSLRQKVAGALLTLMYKYRKNNDQQFLINITRENLATIAGTATESLIRTLTDFRNEKLIDIKDGNIVILNEAKLQGLI